jgi:Anthrax toxin LF subunit
VAQDNDTVIIFQNVNPDAAEHLEEGASPKPMSIKAKTAEDGPAAGLIPLDQSQSKAGNDPKYQAYADQAVANGDATVVKAPDGETDVLGDPKTDKPYTSDYDLLATGSKNPPGTVESDPQLGNVTPEQRGTISDLNDAADNEGGDVVQHGPANQAPTPQPVNYPVTALDPDGSVQSLNNNDELQNYMDQKQGQGYNF